jgi:hypothetical protein
LVLGEELLPPLVLGLLLDGLVLDGLVLELEGVEELPPALEPELMPLDEELEPLAALCPASHSV